LGTVSPSFDRGPFAGPRGTPTWDVAVVGAGPAGAAAALRALQIRPDARVLLLDRSDFPRDKVCGDGIAPQALSVLDALRVPLGEVIGAYPAVPALRLESPGGAVASGRTRRPAYVIPRRILDARLVAAAVARGAVLSRHRVRSVEPRAGEVVLDGDIRARVVIGADGARSAVRRRLGFAPNPPGHVAVAIRGYARVTGPGADRGGEQLIRMAAAGWPAYAWCFPIGDGTANIGYGELLAGAPLSRSWLLARLAALLPTATADPVTLRAAHLPLSTHRPAQPDGRVLLAGDAAALVNPLTGEGIYYAVLSGALAGHAALTGAGAGRVYRRALHARLGRHLRHTGVAARLARRSAVVDAAVAAAGADRRVFDDLAELGLGRGMVTGRTAAALGGRLVRQVSLPLLVRG